MRGKTMAKRHGFTAIWMAATMLLVGQTARAQNGESFKARLSPVPIDVAMMSTVAGSGSLTALLAGNKLTLTGSFEGLRSPATDAHIHRAPKGIRGPAILDLAVTKAASGTISGSLELTPAQVEDLKSGRFYVEINSERAPDGNLWGWLLR
jgi:hypothetical protein